MVIAWLRFSLRQIATALVLVTGVLLLSEILLPSSILPYFNLHILVLVTLMIAIASPVIEEKSRLRIILILPACILLLAYAWFMFGASVSGLALFGALAILFIGLTVALIRREPEETPAIEAEIHVTKETLIINNDGIEIIEEETDVFMR